MVIVKGKVFINGKIEEASIIIEEAIIKDVVKGFNIKKPDKILDFTGKGKLILPGIIDIHVHLRDFEYSYKEDFYTGTLAAAAGGITLVADMPNTKPKVSTLSILERREAIAKSKAIVDYGIYYGVPDNDAEIEGYEKIAVGAKIYPEDLYSERKEVMFKLINYNASKNLLTMFHAENPKFFVNNERPLNAEIKAVEDVVKITKEYGLKTHITHVSNPYDIDLIKNSKVKITTDTCPHYIFLSKNRVHGKYYRVNPPLRTEEIKAKLLEYFIKGKIDALTTDHAPHALEEKRNKNVKPGFPGLETALPLMLTLVLKELISLDRVVKTFVENPAKILGLNGFVGRLSKGYLANLTIVDLNKEYIIDPSLFFSKAKHSPFSGWKVKGKVLATMVRGNIVYKEGLIFVKKGYGMNVKKYCNVFNKEE